MFEIVDAAKSRCVDELGQDHCNPARCLEGNFLFLT